MSLDDLAIHVSNLCATKRISLLTIARRHDWSEGDAEEILRGRLKPTSKMLRDLSYELDIPVNDLLRAIKRPDPPEED
jgi:transcriptional regulator with XRE-family HTH domain